MQILVLSATEQEIAPFLQKKFPADHLITGVGVPATIYHLSKKLLEKKYDLVIQAGIAGCFKGEELVGETYLVEKDVFADAGAVEKGQLFSLFDMQLAGKDEWPFNNGWLKNNNGFLLNSVLKKVNAVTVNTVSDDMHMADLYLKKYMAAIESMEGAAFHYVCLQEKIPFLQLRTISNMVGERDKTKWKMKEAIENLNEELIKLIKHTNQSLIVNPATN